MKRENKLIILSIYILVVCTIIAVGIKMQMDRKIDNETIVEPATIEITTEATTKKMVTTTTKSTTAKQHTATKAATTTKAIKPTEKTTTKTATTTKPIVTTKSLTTSTTKKSEPTTESNSNPIFYLSDYERQVVECVVMGESGNQPYEGQVLVAQCILNACLKDGLQPSNVRLKYQYSGWNSNPSQSVKNAVSAVFDDGYKETNECVLYFYAPEYCISNWHESQKFVCEVGGHRFFAQW